MTERANTLTNSYQVSLRRKAANASPLCRCATSLPKGEASWIARKAKKRQNRSFSDSDVFCIFPKLLVRVLDGGDAVCACGDDEVGAVEEEAGLQNTEGALEECFHGCIVLTKL